MVFKAFVSGPFGQKRNALFDTSLTWNSSIWSVRPTLASTVCRLSWGVMAMSRAHRGWDGFIKAGQLWGSEVVVPPT